MSKRIFVIDTSYLLELYKVGKDWKQENHEIVLNGFNEENGKGSSFYFPIPVLFEFANHIADASNRQIIIKSFKKLIDACLDEDTSYFITPCSSAESVKGFIQDLCNIMDTFKDEFVYQGLGLTDASIISEANRLQNQYKSCEVYIWTLHKALKAHSPNSY